MTGDVRIGTSGWHYRHWRGPFYPADLSPARMLSYYVRHFDTVEINTSFYHLPPPQCFTTWRDSTPPGFCFAVKASRYLTHRKKLHDAQDALDNLLPRVELLGEKMGPVLFQFPPHWRCNPERLEAFLALLPGGHRYAFEFRDPSWHVAPVYELLRQHNAVFCIFELAGMHSPLELTADFAYVRLHGPGDAYQGSYDRDALSAWAERIEPWRADLRAVYVYFDNAQAGYAAHNALELKRLLRAAPPPAGPGRKPPV